jgi:integrase
VTKGESRRRTRANGEGGVRHERARGRWVGTVTVGFEDYVDDEGTIRQRQVRKSITGRTKVEALERLRELQGAVEAGMDPAPRDLTVARFLAMWLDDVLPGTVAPSTEKMYRDVVRLYVVPHIGQKRLRTLQAHHVSLMLRALEAEGRAGNTRRLARSVLRRALRWGEAEGMVARNVAAIADGVKVGTREGRTLTPVQARQLLAHVDGDRMEAAFAVALALGLRRAELLGLAWSDLTLDATPPRLTVRGTSLGSADGASRSTTPRRPRAAGRSTCRSRSSPRCGRTGPGRPRSGSWPAACGRSGRSGSTLCSARRLAHRSTPTTSATSSTT